MFTMRTSYIVALPFLLLWQLALIIPQADAAAFSITEPSSWTWPKQQTFLLPCPPYAKIEVCYKTQFDGLSTEE
jgi:hypothetical protein